MKAPIHVAMIIQGYSPRMGGAERQLEALAPALKAENVNISVLTRRYPGFEPFKMINDVPVYRLPIPGPVPIAATVFTIAAIPLLRRLQPDVVHAHEFYSPATTAIAAKQVLGFPYVVTSHRSGPLGDVLRMEERPFGKSRLQRIKKTADAFVNISHEIDDELDSILGIEPGRRHYVPNGVDINDFAPVDREKKAELRRKLNLPVDGTITIYVGRLVPHKRVNHLVNVWKNIRPHYPDATLVVVGTGEEAENLRAIADQDVIFTGLIDEDLKISYLQAADIFVLPSTAEGFSVAMLEAMSTGLTMILTDVGGMREAVDDGVHGLIIQPDDPQALQTALERVLENPTERHRMSNAARDRIVRDFSLAAAAARLRSLYEDIALRNAHSKYAAQQRMSKAHG